MYFFVDTITIRKFLYLKNVKFKSNFNFFTKKKNNCSNNGSRKMKKNGFENLK